MKSDQTIFKNHFLLIVIVISAAVATLIHFPEMISIFDIYEQFSLFPGMKPEDVVFEIVFTFFSLVILFLVNAFIFKFNKKSVRIGFYEIAISFVITWMLSNGLGKFFVILHHHYNIPAIDAMVHHYLHPLRDFIITCVVTGSCYMIHLVRRQQMTQVENVRLRAENLQNQYEALKNQLNPHMLFNSLNTLRSLVRESQEKAQEYIQELSRVLRYTLQGNDIRQVPLSNEMEFVSAYIFLQMMRYEDNLSFEIQVDEELGNKQVPPMAVQLLIENAIKHNEISNRRPLMIQIRTEGREWLSVCNRIQPKITGTTTGIGLANLNKRYELLFRRQILIETTEEIFCVKIPLL